MCRMRFSDGLGGGLVSSADRAYMKPPSLVPRFGLRVNLARCCIYTSAKIAERTAPVKVEMNGLAPDLDRRRPSR